MINFHSLTKRSLSYSFFAYLKSLPLLSINLMLLILVLLNTFIHLILHIKLHLLGLSFRLGLLIFSCYYSCKKINKNNTTMAPLNIFTFLCLCIIATVWAIYPAFLFVLILFCLVLYFLHKENNDFLINLFIVGFLLRASCSLILFYKLTLFSKATGFPIPNSIPSIFGDAIYYLGSSMLTLTNIDHHSMFYLNELQQLLKHLSPFTIYIVILYHFFGFCPEAINMINCLLGSCIPIIIYYFSIKIFNLQTAKLASVLTMFSPSLFGLSLIAFKDILLVFLFVIFMKYLSEWCTQRKIIHLVMAISFLKLLSFFRAAFSFYALFSLFIISYYLSSSISWFRKISLIIITIGLYTALVPSGVENIHNKILNNLNYMYNRHVSFFGSNHDYKFLDEDSYLDSGINFTKINIIQQSKIITKAIGHFLFEPFMWKIENFKTYLFYYPQLLLIYISLPFVIAGIFVSLKNTYTLPSFFFILAFLTALAITSGNTGTVLRHRELISPFYLTFAAGGLNWILNLKKIK